MTQFIMISHKYVYWKYKLIINSNSSCGWFLHSITMESAKALADVRVFLFQNSFKDIYNKEIVIDNPN